MKRYTMSIAASIAFLLFLLAIWSEAAYHASHVGFNELLTWDKMLPAFTAVQSSHIGQLDEMPIPMGIIAVAGMLASIGIGLVSSWRPPIWAVASYTGLLLLAGGWIGLFIPLFLFQPLDGEFLDEGMARMTICGLWSIILICYIINRLIGDWKQPNTNLEPISGS